MSENEAESVVGKAIDVLGGDSAVARLAVPAITPWAVSKWRDNLPANRVLWLAEQTGWKFTPHMLAPSLYPNPTDGLPVRPATLKRPARGPVSRRNILSP